MKRTLPLPLLLGSAMTAAAHPAEFHGIAGSDAAISGLLHPFSGLDHLLVMIAVGLWAARIGGVAVPLLPLAFAGSMLSGGFLALSGMRLAAVEPGILASLLLLGAALGMSWRPPLAIAALFVGCAGICHGFAHGAEMAPGTSASLYFSGMMVSTLLLLGLGLGAGLLPVRNRCPIGSLP
jgi:urease accessory protein